MKVMERINAIGPNVAEIKKNLTRLDPTKVAGAQVLEAGERQIQYKEGRISERTLFLGELIRDVLEGHKDPFYLKEAMSTSDFPLLFGDLLYRQLLGNFDPFPVSYPDWCRVKKVRDFRKLHMYMLDGGNGTLEQVKERAPYPEVHFTESAKTLQVYKYGKRYGISFEMVKNDDLDAFSSRPLMMAIGARRSEELLMTQQLCGVNGPNATTFAAGNSNIVTGNPRLSVQALQTAMQILAAQTDSDGQPITITGAVLVVSPALEITAMNILNALEITISGSGGGDTNGGGTSAQVLRAQNWMKNKLKLSVNSYIPIVATTANANTSWFVIANPQDETQRPMFVFGNLLGYEKPQLLVKAPNSMLLGGGDASVMDGDFDTDVIDYKLRHFMGAVTVEPKLGVASNGSEVA